MKNFCKSIPFGWFSGSGLSSVCLSPNFTSPERSLLALKQIIKPSGDPEVMQESRLIDILTLEDMRALRDLLSDYVSSIAAASCKQHCRCSSMQKKKPENS